MLGKGSFKHWALPHNDRYVVLWVKLACSEQLVFLDWCAKSGITLFNHVVTADYLLPSARADASFARKEGLRGLPVDHAQAKKFFEENGGNSTIAAWYMIEREGAEDNLILMKMKWS
jgi:hypothetical protein